MPRSVFGLIAVCLVSHWAGSAFAQETAVKWERIKFEDAFRAEGVAVGDFNKDGRLDITNGEAWYEAPADANMYKTGNWAMRPLRPQNPTPPTRFTASSGLWDAATGRQIESESGETSAVGCGGWGALRCIGLRQRRCPED